jgi:peptidoglycan/LPS O-acetylase OafA/YrhL
MPGANSRLIGLDFLRFFVATIVCSAHAQMFGNAGNIFYRTPGWPGSILNLIPGAGWVAVDIFFVLSGFLVSGLIFQEARERGTISVAF